MWYLGIFPWSRYMYLVTAPSWGFLARDISNVRDFCRLQWAFRCRPVLHVWPFVYAWLFLWLLVTRNFWLRNILDMEMNNLFKVFPLKIYIFSWQGMQIWHISRSVDCHFVNTSWTCALKGLQFHHCCIVKRTGCVVVLNLAAKFYCPIGILHDYASFFYRNGKIVFFQGMEQVLIVFSDSHRNSWNC